MPAQLNQHISCHTHKECVICGKKYAYSSLLQTHIAAVHEKKKPFECRICQMKFAYKRNVKSHIDLVHEHQREKGIVKLIQHKWSLQGGK